MDKKYLWSFEKWIVKFKEVDLPIGDLAKQIAEDPDFPPGDYLCDNINYLMDKKASSETIKTLCEAWNFYVASTGTTDDVLRVHSENGIHKDF